MGALQFHVHQQQTSPMFMTPISVSVSFPCNLRGRATSILFKCFSSTSTSTSSPTSSSSRSVKTKLVDKKDELKDQWLTSLNCPQTLDHTTIGEQTTPWVIGIDPDVSGAMAVLKSFHDFTCSSSAQVYDSPNVKVLIGNRIRRRMDTKAMVELLRSLTIPIGTTAYIEQSLPYPGDGKQGWWSGGFNYGLWIGVLVASGVSVVPVPSVRWKQEFKLSGNGKTKDDSRALACTLFPTLSSSLKRKKDHGRAEALLIAAYGKGIRLKSDYVSESLTAIDTDSSTLQLPEANLHAF